MKRAEPAHVAAYDGQSSAGKVYLCSRCSHQWVARKRSGIPKNCPKCRSTVWMKDYRVCKCYRCNHQWGTARGEPKRCPKCHSVYWNVPIKGAAAGRRVRSTTRSAVDVPLREDIIRRYSEGESCTEIAIGTGVSFSDVYAIVKEAGAGDTILI